METISLDPKDGPSVAVEARFDAFRGRGIQILERIAVGAPPTETFDQVIALIEEQSPGAIATILVMEADGQHLRHGAAPSLPPAYADAVRRVRIGPAMGSCGTAAHSRQRVVVADLDVSPLWDVCRHLVVPFALRSCWSEPVFNGEGMVLGTFAVYHSRPAEPSETDLQILQLAAHLVGIAMERDRREEERRLAERQRAQIEKKMIEAQKLESLGVLAGGIAHDFNNLLTGVLGYAGLIRRELPERSSLHELVTGIEHTTQRAADLCKQMLAYAGRGRFVVQALDLAELVRQSVPLLHLSIGKKAALSLDLPRGLPLVEADATQMSQILMNLVINASEAIGDKGGRIQVSAGLLHADRACLDTAHLAPELPEGDYVTLVVTDDGCGMDDETRVRIFEPFFTTKFTGRGLGLAAVLGIVRAHKGALKVFSTPGLGSTFKLLLPAVPGTLHDQTPTAPPVATGTGGILIVDDEETVRDVAAKMLRSLGFETTTAVDGLDALRQCRARPVPFELVLLDLTMPNLNGEETFREIRRLDPAARVLLMSGYAEQEATALFAGKRLAGFLQKPFTLEALQAKVVEALNQRAST